MTTATLGVAASRNAVAPLRSIAGACRANTSRRSSATQQQQQQQQQRWRPRIQHPRRRQRIATVASSSSSSAAANGGGDDVSKKRRAGAVAAAVAAVLATGVLNRVLYRIALVPLKDHVFALALSQTFGYILIYTSLLALRCA